MQFLIKWPTRSRPEKFIRCLYQWISKASLAHDLCFLVSQHDDDPCRLQVYQHFGVDAARPGANIYRPQCSFGRLTVDFIEGPVKTKVENINYGIGDRAFDVLMNAADDMWPEVEAYDDIIAKAMQRHFPAFDGALNFWDGKPRGPYFCTLSIMGFKLYRYFGYIYHPSYISLYCDNEFQEVCERLGRIVAPEGWRPGEKCLIRHKHPMFTGEPYDPLMKHTESFYAQDGKAFQERKARNFDIKEFA